MKSESNNVEQKFCEQVKLDKYNLDSCALEQPILYAEWGIAWAHAVDTRDRKKDELAVIRCDCDGEIRATPSEFGWENIGKPPTETFIASKIIGHEKVRECNEEYLVACRIVNTLVVAKEAFDQRRRMIEVLQQLYSGNYFSGNKEMDDNYKTATVNSNEIAQNKGLEEGDRKRIKRR